MPSQRFLNTIDLPLSTRITVNLPRRKRGSGDNHVTPSQYGPSTSYPYPLPPSPPDAMDWDPQPPAPSQTMYSPLENLEDEEFYNKPSLLLSNLEVPEYDIASLDPLCDCPRSPCQHSTSLFQSRMNYNTGNVIQPHQTPEYNTVNAVLAEVAVIQQMGCRSTLEKRSRDRDDAQERNQEVAIPIKRAKKVERRHTSRMQRVHAR